MTKIQLRQFAETLHANQCNLEHEDQCGWYWEQVPDYPGGTWSGYAHKRWLKKAESILLHKLSGIDISIILKVMEALK